ncbi:hypothetical protein LXA47_27895 [Massilia sp. P8910]|uniref:DUF3742 family protein n=1 Tax=Massilia antarctica TaxID=2765360 RepID=A0AA48WH03_9BURK|nr:hypothetical protein [Massilia antarctica]MCE3607394.1 hypothetical protein [Massilia antarctica]QPI52560.1 hypothetical protein IV454_14345 [Massilia antarctica]
MNNPAFTSFFASLEDLGRTLVKAARYAVGAIATMSWPTLLLSAVGLALLLTIVPLVLTLFVLFMVIKLVHGYMSDRATRGPATPCTPVKPEGE